MNRAKGQSSLLVEPGDLVFSLKYHPLEQALTRLIGSDWTRHSHRAITSYYLRRLMH